MKDTRLINGLRRLGSIQKPNQEFTVQEIAAECGVTDRAITLLEQRARARLFRALIQKRHRPMLREIFPRHPLFPCVSS
jgi:hypothetical protein